MDIVPLDQLVGQIYASRFLQRMATSDRVSHAYLFLGPEGTGRKTAAKSFARALTCPVEPLGCGNCSSCVRARSGTHPDIKHIRGESSLGIDQVRSVQADAWLKPTGERFKVYIFENVETLTPVAANSLLKILEDPPASCIFILIGTDADTILETITSRCQIVAFRPSPQSEIQEFLLSSGLSKEEARIYAACSQGILGKSLVLADSEEFRKERELAFDIVAKSLDARGSGVLDLAEKLEGAGERVIGVLDLLASIYRDIILWRATGTTDYNENLDASATLVPIGQALGLGATVGCLQAVQDAQIRIHRNANRRIVLDVLAFRLSRLSAQAI